MWNFKFKFDLILQTTKIHLCFLLNSCDYCMILLMNKKKNAWHHTINMNPEDPSKKIMDISLQVAGVCMRLTGNRYNAKEAAEIIQRMMDNVDILVMQIMETKCKRLQTSLNKSNRLKNELYNQVQGLKRKKNFCEMCNSTIEESFADEKDSITSPQIMQTLPSPLPGSPELASTPSPESDSTQKRSHHSLSTRVSQKLF